MFMDKVLLNLEEQSKIQRIIRMDEADGDEQLYSLLQNRLSLQTKQRAHFPWLSFHRYLLSFLEFIKHFVRTQLKFKIESPFYR